MLNKVALNGWKISTIVQHLLVKWRNTSTRKNCQLHFSKNLHTWIIFHFIFRFLFTSFRNALICFAGSRLFLFTYLFFHVHCISNIFTFTPTFNISSYKLFQKEWSHYSNHILCCMHKSYLLCILLLQKQRT